MHNDGSSKPRKLRLRTESCWDPQGNGANKAWCNQAHVIAQTQALAIGQVQEIAQGGSAGIAQSVASSLLSIMKSKPPLQAERVSSGSIHNSISAVVKAGSV